MLRKAILAAAESPRLQRVVRRHGMRLGAARFVAGETLDEAVARPAAAEREGPAHEHDAARRGRRERGRDARRSSTRTASSSTGSRPSSCATNVALKLTHLGLAFDEELALANIGELVAHAAGRGNFIRHRHGGVRATSTPTLRIYRRLREDGPRRTSAPCSSRTSTAARPTSRRCSRSRRTSASSRARTSSRRTSRTRRRSDVDAAYARLLERSLTAGGFTAIATHDETLIEHAIAFAEGAATSRASASSSRCSTACGRRLQLDLVRPGYDVLVATPYGPDWYRYLMRRLAERPANVLFIARNLVRR